MAASLWRSARTALAGILSAVTIDTPVAATIKATHATPPSSISDFPCWIIYPPAVNVDRRPSRQRVNDYTVRCRLLVSDAKMSDAADLVDEFREAAIDIFDSNLRLGVPIAKVTLVREQHVDEAAAFSYPDGKIYIGFDMQLTIRLDVETTYSL